MVPTILRSYGTAAELFARSGKGWHGFFAATPNGPRFLSPTELAVAQGFPWGFALPGCRLRAWQLLGNSVPPPMALLGLLGPAAALGSAQGGPPGAAWAAEVFLACCRASDGRWSIPTRQAP